MRKSEREEIGIDEWKEESLEDEEKILKMVEEDRIEKENERKRENIMMEIMKREGVEEKG